MPIISIAFYAVLIRIAMRRLEGHSFSTAPVDSQRAPLQVHISQFSKNDVTPSYQSGLQEIERTPQTSTDKPAADRVGYIA